MERILHPETINQTIRFFFKTRIDSDVCTKLITNLNLNSPEYIEHKTDSNYKFINFQNKTSIEITDSYISFFPENMFSNRKEELRKKIYEVVALKTEVYLKTAKNNYNLGLSSLLSGDLRSSANLFYYSFHKFYSSSLYNYLNTEAQLSDDKINIEEIRHFGDRLYERNIENLSLNTTIDESNYSEILTSRVNPFLVTRVIFEDFNLSIFQTKLLNYLQYVCLTKWNLNLSEVNYTEHIPGLINALENEDSEKSIDTALLNILLKIDFDDILTFYYVMDFIGLRLYWLRQTADYDYDFEVKTTVREFSILADALESILFEYEWIPRFYRSFSKKEETNNESAIKSIEFYPASIPFDPKINFISEKSIAYFSALHIDSDFDKDLIIDGLNLSEFARNEGDYFSIYFSKKKDCEFYVHISREGRWFCWMETIGYNIEINLILKEEFRYFLDRLFEVMEKICSIPKEYKIIATKIEVIYSDLENEINFDGLINSQKNINEELLNKEIKLTDIISKNLNIENSKIKNNFIINGQNSIAINLVIVDQNFTNLITKGFDYLIDFHSEQQGTKDYININICITLDFNDPHLENLINLISREFLSNFNQSFDNLKSHTSSNNIFINSKELNEILITEHLPANIQEKILTHLNNHIYFHMKKGLFLEEFRDTLECISNKSDEKNFYWATLGMWYFRNSNIPFECALKNGSKYYERTMQLRPDLIDTIEYNYNFELGYCLWNADLKIEALTYLEKAKSSLIKINDEVIDSEIENEIFEIDQLINSIERPELQMNN